MNDRFSVILFGSFAALGLLLASMGIYGVTGFSVTQRLQEMAVRMAVGATKNDVVALLVKEGATLAIGGVALGLIGAWFAGRAMQSVLYGVASLDVPAFGGTALLLLGASLVACYLPALRVTTSENLTHSLNNE